MSDDHQDAGCTHPDCQPTPRAPEVVVVHSIDGTRPALVVPAREPSAPDDLREQIAEAAYTTADEYRRTPLPKKNDHELAARIAAAVMDLLRREGLVTE